MIEITKDAVNKPVCYCCTCPYDEHTGAVRGWDPACHNHGAHGVRGCERHGVPAKACDCGCEDA